MTNRRELEAWVHGSTESPSVIEVEGYVAVEFEVQHQHGAEPIRLFLEGTDKEILKMMPVSTLEDVENLRILRNECRAYMTHNTDEITQAQQRIWWQGAAGNPQWIIWLVYVPGWDEPVGFALLRKTLTRWYCSLGLRSWLRGQRYGTLIYGALAQVVPDGEVWAAIRTDNPASIRASQRAGYVEGPWTIEGQIAMVGRRQS